MSAPGIAVAIRDASTRCAAASVRAYARLRIDANASFRPLSVRAGRYSASGGAASVTTTSTPGAAIGRAGAAAGRATSSMAAATRPRFRTGMVCGAGLGRAADPGPSAVVDAGPVRAGSSDGELPLVAEGRRAVSRWPADRLRRGAGPPAKESRDEGAATLCVRADVAELVDAHGSGPCGGDPVEVQVLSSA